MFHVYILASINNPSKIYVGYTENVEKRLKAHNKGLSCHTNKFKPWKLEAYISFTIKKNAIAFEKYLKTHSGRSFLRKRFIS